MENSYSAKRAAVAILLVLVLVFSVPMNLVTMKTASVGSVPMAQNNADTAYVNTDNILNTEDIPSSVPVIQAETEITDTDDDKYKEEESMPGGDTSLLPDEILPDADEGFTDIGNEYVEKEGVTVVPAALNNIMLDSLPSIISKKVYTFSLNSRGAIKCAFNHTLYEEKTCLWYITLYEEYSPDGSGTTIDYRVLNRLTYESVGTGVQSAVIGVLPGNYRVEVECVSGYTAEKYQLAIGFAETPYYEAEPNNTASRYTNLPLNRTVNGSASVLPNSEADEDCYLFRVTDAGYTVLYFEHEADPSGSVENVAWRVRLTDEAGTEFFYTTSTMDKAMINSGIMGLSPGYYFITVSSHMYSSVEYSLNVSFTQDSAVETELNDTPETADPIEINTEKVGSLTERYEASDRDYYSFTMKNDGFVVIDFMHEAMTETNDGWNVSMYSSDGRLIFSAVSDWSQAVLQSPNIGLTAGDYYIKIDSDNLYYNSMVYRLILLSVQNTGWETEPNNMPADADILEIGSTVNGTLVETGVDYDRDWYRITLDEEQKLSFSFGHIKTDEADKEGWIVSLVDSNGNIIGELASDWDDEEKSFSKTLAPGSYFILIETGLYYNSNRYILTVTE